MVFTETEIEYLASQRLGRLRRGHLVSVQPWRVRCLEIRGVAEALTTEGGPLIRLHPKRIISFGVDEPEMEAHRLTSNNRDVG